MPCGIVHWWFYKDIVMKLDFFNALAGEIVAVEP